MAVAFDAAVGSTSSSWSHTNSGNAILVGVCSGTGSSDVVTAVSYGGVALAKLGHINSDNQSSGGCSLWGKFSATLPTGSNTVSVTGFTLWAGSASYTGAGSIGTAVTAFGNSGSGSVSISGTTTGGMCAAVNAFGTSATVSATSPGSKRWDEEVNSLSGAGCGWYIDRASVGGGSATSVAWTDTGSDWYGIVGVEILPPTTTTYNRSLTTSATAQASFAGTRTQFKSLTATATAKAVFGGYVPQQFTSQPGQAVVGLMTPGQPGETLAVTQIFNRSLTATVTAAASFGGTKTAFRTFTPAATAHTVFAGTKTAFKTLAAAATAQASFGGIKTVFPVFSPAVTAQASFRAVHPGHLTPAATAHAVFSVTQSQFGVFTAAATAHAVFTRTRTTFGGLTSSATAQASFQAVHPGHLAPGVTANAVFGNTMVTKLRTFTAAVTAHAVFTRTRTTFGTVISAAAARAAFSGTKIVFGGFTASVTAGITATGHGPNVVRAPENLGGVVVVEDADSGNQGPAPEVFGGTVTIPADYGGGATISPLSGSMSETPNALGGTISETDLGGTINLTNYGGSAVGWTMQNVNLNFAEFNDITLSVSITSNGSPLNLTGYTVNMLLKPSAGIVDTDPRVITLSSSGGSPAITVTSAVNGQCTVAITHADVQDQTHAFYRIDAVDASGNINTAIYGNITYTAL